MERNYKHMSTLSTYIPNLRTTTKFFTISQALYIPDIFGTKQDIASLSKFLERSGIFTKNGIGPPRWKPSTINKPLPTEYDMKGSEKD